MGCSLDNYFTTLSLASKSFISSETSSPDSIFLPKSASRVRIFFRELGGKTFAFFFLNNSCAIEGKVLEFSCGANF